MGIRFAPILPGYRLLVEGEMVKEGTRYYDTVERHWRLVPEEFIGKEMPPFRRWIVRKEEP